MCTHTLARTLTQIRLKIGQRLRVVQQVEVNSHGQVARAWHSRACVRDTTQSFTVPQWQLTHCCEHFQPKCAQIWSNNNMFSWLNPVFWRNACWYVLKMTFGFKFWLFWALHAEKMYYGERTNKLLWVREISFSSLTNFFLQ